MSFWAIFFIVLAIAMAVGPIMLMQPSKRDRRLAALRSAAAMSGLSVHMSDYINGNNKQAVAVYTMAVELPQEAPSWQLLKRTYKHDIHFYGQWDWQKEPDPLMRQEKQLKALLDDLPDDIVGLEVNKNLLGIWWRERPSPISIDDIKQWLNRCHNIVS
ncbi:MAG: hypothetical protein ACRBCI_01935 [Cellvibrionaceae bacterium]